MKKLILFSILSSLIFASGKLQYNECKTDIYYANGILTFRKDARRNGKILRNSILANIYKNSEKNMHQHIGKFDVAYNHTEGTLVDLIESIEQKNISDEKLQYYYDKLKDYYKNKTNQEQKDRWFDDLKTQIKGYKESIKDHSHRVLIVAHSQGNLFTYEAYTLLKMNSQTKWMTNYIYTISVASPLVSNIIPNTPVICFDNDLVCKTGLHSGFKNPIRSVDWSRDDENTKTTEPLLSDYLYKDEIGKEYEGYISDETLWGMDWKFNVHSFSYYMGQNIMEENNQTVIDPFTSLPLHTDLAKNKIIFSIKQGLKILSEKPSMWKIIKYPKDRSVCKNIRVELAHKFDKNIADISQVYPFDTKNFKLYPINKEYVIAKCGGEKIENSWTEQSDKQCYKLDPNGDIISKINYIYYISFGRPWASIYSSRLSMCRVDMDDPDTSRKCMYIASGQSGNGFRFWDVFDEGPCQGYDRYLNSKWAGTEYEGVFNDQILSLVPFQKATGWLCDNYDRGYCNRNDNFKTYYELTWSSLFENAYNKLMGE